MALTPVVLALNASGLARAQTIARALDAPLHGRTGRVGQADAFFDNALDHARDLFAAGIPIVGVCASGILIRAVAPLLNDKTQEPPVVSVADDGSVVVPLLGGASRGQPFGAPHCRGSGQHGRCDDGGGCVFGCVFG